MSPMLKNDHKNTGAILEHASRVARKHLDRSDALPPGRFIKDIEKGKLPEEGVGAMQTIDNFEREFAPLLANSAGPRYFGFVTGGSTPASVAGDWLVSAFDQNACGSNDTIAPQIEARTIHFLKQLFGFDESYYGSFVTGATMSNFVGLALGRQWIGEQYGQDFSNEGVDVAKVKVASATPHSSIIKSLSMLGIGRNALVKVDTLPDREAIDVSKLETFLSNHDAPAIVVASAGTVNTVDFDDLEAIGKLKSKYHFWLHVDAAFGAFAAVSPKFQHLMHGINHADSITVDAHKWLNVPYDAAMQFTKHKSLQLKVFQNSAAYLGDPESSPDYFHYTPENSRRFRALPSWFTLMAYGREGYKEIVERNCACAIALGSYLDKSFDFRLLAPVRMNVVCFTFKEKTATFAEVQKFLNAVRDDGRVFFTPTIYKGVPAIRAAVSNWQTTLRDMELAFTVLTEVRKQIDTKHSFA